MADVVQQQQQVQLPRTQVVRVGRLGDGVDAGQHITDLLQRGGPGTRVLLQPGLTYELHSKILIQHDDQEIATDGYPTFNDRKARLVTRGKSEASAIEALNRKNTTIKCLYIDGRRTEYGYNKDVGGALIVIGGWDAKDPVIDRCVLTDPRGWSCCHLVDGSQGGRIVNNEIGPAGQPAPDGPWADGLSIACRNGLIANNTIVDATDGAIVVFCAPGTTIVGNTIIARTRNAMGAINLVDPFPFECNYAGTRVVKNHIISDGAFIHLAIGIGPNAWSDNQTEQNYGGVVMDNLIGPGRFGYGIGAGGCKDFTVIQNRVAAGTIFGGSMDVIPDITPPTPFLRKNNHLTTGTWQAEFVEGPVRFLIGIREGVGRKMQFRASALRWQTQLDGSDGSASCKELRDARFELSSQEGRLLVWDQHVPGRILWASPAGRKRRRDSVNATFGMNGQTGQIYIAATVEMSSTASHESKEMLWDPTRYLLDIRYMSPKRDPVLHLSDAAPYLHVRDDGNILFSSNYAFDSFELLGGRFVAIVSEKNGAAHEDPAHPPPVPYAARPGGAGGSIDISQGVQTLNLRQDSHSVTWLYLEPKHSQLVLHTSATPWHVEERHVVWRSPNWKMSESVPEDPSHANLQGDGNFVIYSSKVGAVWATGTNTDDAQGLRLVLVASGEDEKGARVELHNPDGKRMWSSMK